MCLKLLVISVILLFKIASGNDDYNWDPQNRLAPPEPSTNHDDYIISEQRLKEIRQNFLYWFFDKDALGGRGDLQTQIHTASPQIEKNLNFYLPFFGNRFNYTRVSINGYLEFSDAPQYYTYPLRFPIKDWPKVNDPSFIAIFYSKCRPGIIYETDIDQRSPGVYFRLENDLITRTDRFGVEVRERVMWDIREGIIGAQNFIPKHVIFVTWKNLTFSGGIDAARSTTNTFQLALATDELHTYAIFNYMLIEWTSHPEAGGDVQNGFGGISAFVGFNSGNGTQSYEYLPYSQSPMIQDLKTKGFSNSFPGRHIFRIDETIMLVTCTKDMYDSQLQFIFSPETGMSGTIVYITGPCFDSSQIILCHFGTEDVVGTVVDRHRVFCIQPVLKTQGLISLEISVGNQRFKSNKKYLVTI